MKAIFAAYNQAYNEEIIETLEECGERGFTSWNETGGRGSVTGEPHYGNHAWPTMNHAVFAVVKDENVPEILRRLREKDASSPDLGLRAWVLPVEDQI